MKISPPRNFNKLLVILIIALVMNSLVLNIRLSRLQNFITDFSIRNSKYFQNVFDRSLDSAEQELKEKASANPPEEAR